MSVPYLVGSLSSLADRRKKELDYKNYLALRAKLNLENADALEVQEQIHQGLIQAPVRMASTEEALKNINLQREQAIQNLTSLKNLKPAIATDFVSISLPSLNQLVLFNQSWGSFKNELTDKTNITADYLGRLWNDYLNRQSGKATDTTPEKNVPKKKKKEEKEEEENINISTWIEIVDEYTITRDFKFPEELDQFEEDFRELDIPLRPEGVRTLGKALNYYYDHIYEMGTEIEGFVEGVRPPLSFVKNEDAYDNVRAIVNRYRVLSEEKQAERTGKKK